MTIEEKSYFYENTKRNIFGNEQYYAKDFYYELHKYLVEAKYENDEDNTFEYTIENILVRYKILADNTQGNIEGQLSVIGSRRK